MPKMPRYRLKIAFYGSYVITDWTTMKARVVEDAQVLRRHGFNVVVQMRSGMLALDCDL